MRVHARVPDHVSSIFSYVVVKRCEPGLGQVDQQVEQGVLAKETLLLEKLFLLGLDAEEHHAPPPTQTGSSVQ